MRKNVLEKLAVVAAITVMTGAMLAGCGSNADNKVAENEASQEAITDETVAEAAEPGETTEEAADSADEKAEGVSFNKGVYVNYAKDDENPEKTNFYVFSDVSYGYTEDGATGMGLPFSCEQGDGVVKFSFGGADGSEDELTITANEGGVVEGHFADGREMVFEPVADADPDNFSAENYVNGPEDSVYRDANGWSVKYDATKFEINQSDGQVFIVYTGECAGSTLITASFTPEKKAEEAIKDMVESWGNDKTTTSEGIFPGTEDVKSYYASFPADKEGSGLYEAAFARDYMDGSLVFEVIGHEGEDEEQNIAVSDDIASVIDSLTFDFQ